MTPERFSHTKALRLKLRDKPNISFTDLFSMIIIEELNISYVLTGDAHFTHTGLAVQVVPQLD
jgi:predicted nucleic acid-binding protein